MSDITMTSEQDAALEEGFSPMPEDLIHLYEERQSLKEQIEELEGRAKEIRDVFEERLRTEGLRVFTLNGKNKVRRTEIESKRVDAKELEKKMPHIYAKFLKFGKSVRVDFD